MKTSIPFSVFIMVFLIIPLMTICQVPDIRLSEEAGKQTSEAPASKNLLYGQLSNPANEPAIACQDFMDSPPHSCQAADDFIVPPGNIWMIEQVYVAGQYSIAGTFAEMAHLFIYFHDAALNRPGPPMFELMGFPLVPQTDGSLLLEFTGNPFILPEGQYWLCVQPFMPAEPMGQWYWKKQESPTVNSALHWRNPGGGFGLPWIDWSHASDVFPNTTDHNLTFALYGTNTSVEPQLGSMSLVIGDWLIAEEWHDWIGGMSGESKVRLMADDPMKQISKVNFYYSINGQLWIPYYTDTDGSQPFMSTTKPTNKEGDGWCSYFIHEMLPPENVIVHFMAEAHLFDGEIVYVENSIAFDPSPPSSVMINIMDWLIIQEDQIVLEINPGDCYDLTSVWWNIEPKADSFAKGIPPISQQPHSPTHCSPTAAAACLKYFEGTGDNTIAGGLDDHDLVDSLAARMGTNQGVEGTYIENIASGLSGWVQDHGNNYTVRLLDFDWETMRNELERCQDVIASIFWPEGGGHSMTFNSIVNEPDMNGKIRVDFMDPWTGEIEWGDMDPATGEVSGFTGAGEGGEMGPMVIVCPKESNSTPGYGNPIPWPYPGPIIIPVPQPGLYFLRIIFRDASNHVYRRDLVVKREDPMMDFGDAPNSYKTLLASDGARHAIDPNIYLGNLIDPEPDGFPSFGANGDDLNNLPDEDGVVFRTPLVAGKTAVFKVFASATGYLNAWLDMNKDGTFADAFEHVFDDVLLAPGWNTLSLNITPNALPGNSYMRFRFSTMPGLSYFGFAPNGEVEDYRVTIYPQGWSFTPTPVFHTIAIPLNVVLNGVSLNPDDLLGVFYTDNNGNEACGGAVAWDAVNNLALLTYGDDQTTPSKEGFDEGETMSWKIYSVASATEQNVSVIYNPNYPQHDGAFTSFGLSALLQIGGIEATATAVPDNVCEGDDVQLDVIVTGGSGNYAYSWSSDPEGFASDLKDPVANPYVNTTYFVAVTDGGVTITASVDVSVQAAPVVSLIPDVTICEGDVLQLNAVATNYSSVAWATTGDGFFTDEFIPDPVYTPGPQDISDGYVILSIIVLPIDPCTINAEAGIGVTIQHFPFAYAGGDATICPGESYTLAGVAFEYDLILWSTTGDGIFDDAANLNATYTPGTGDIALGYADLCLSAFPISPCNLVFIDCMTLYFHEEQSVYLFAGWNGLSSYLSPYNKNDNYQLFSPILNQLIVAYNFQGSFWPAQGNNTFAWNEASGCIVKMNSDGTMVFCGDEVANKQIQLAAGWSIVPVLSPNYIDITTIFNASVDVKLVVEVANWKLFWPDYGINTILNMHPGKAYYAYMNSPGSIDFGNTANKSQFAGASDLVNLSPWNSPTFTTGIHAVAFSQNACSDFSNGDIIGAFTRNNLCAGMAIFESQSLGIMLFANDQTSNGVVGFEPGETISFKLFRPATGEVFDLEVHYNPNLDKSGTFSNFGISAIEALKLSPANIMAMETGEINIFPNPSEGIFTVQGVEPGSRIKVFNAFGNLIYHDVLNGNTLDISGNAKGVYFIAIKTLNGMHHQKIIIN